MCITASCSFSWKFFLFLLSKNEESPTFQALFWTFFGLQSSLKHFLPILIIKLSLNHHLMALWAQTLFPFPRAYTALCYVRFGCVLLEMVWYWPLWQVVTWDFTSTAFVGTQVLVRASQNNTRSRSSIRMGLWTNFIFSNLRSYILWRN